MLLRQRDAFQAPFAIPMDVVSSAPPAGYALILSIFSLRRHSTPFAVNPSPRLYSDGFHRGFFSML